MLGFYVVFEKKYIDDNGQKVEVFCFKTVEIGYLHRDYDNEHVIKLVTGAMPELKVSELSVNRNEKYDYVGRTYTIESLVDAFKTTDFSKIKNGMSKRFENKVYYVRSSDGDDFIPLQNQILLEKAKKAFGEVKKEFSEESLNSDSDISKIYSSIRKTIISQDEQVMQILTSLFKNQTVVNSDFDSDVIGKLKENILICGPTGTGKTEILKRIAKIYEVPIVIEDSTSFSETGFVGRSITDMLEDLYIASGRQMAIAEKGILVLDEFDKLAEKDNSRSHVSRDGVQRSLLKLLDGSCMYVDNKQFDTSKLTVVALGAFSGITSDEDYHNLTTSDFVNYGIMRELMGRFSKIITMNRLSKDDLKCILIESDFSPLNTYKPLLEKLNVKMDYNSEFVDWIATRAYNLNSGARSLKTIFDECISGALFQIFAGEYTELHLQTPNTDDNPPYTLIKRKH